MRGSQWALALKGMFADRAVVLSAFLVVLLAASLVAAIPIYANAVAQGSLRERLQRAPTTEANLQATVDIFYGDVDPSLDPRVQRIVRNAFGATRVAIHRSAESEPFTLRSRTAVFGFFHDLDRHARLLVGRWPASRAAPVEVVVPAPVARELRIRVGDSVSARSRVDEDRVVTARVVGIYRVERPSSVYWWDQPLAANGALGLLIADEPTAQLDSQRARTIMGLLRKLVDERGVSVIVATHDPILIEMADRAVELRDGSVVADSDISLATSAGAT